MDFRKYSLLWAILFLKGGEVFSIPQIVLKGDQSCVLSERGEIKCWGRNHYGQLGAGNTEDRGDQPNEMGENLPAVDLGEKAISLAVGNFHACALLENRKIKCWGNNFYGQLGQGDKYHRGDEPDEMGGNLPYVDLGNEKVLSLVAGSAYFCALLKSGRVKCWGHNQYGVLGLGGTAPRGDEPNEMGDNLPYVDLGKEKAIFLVAGGHHTCAILENRKVKCWGNNDRGQLGLGDVEIRGDEPDEMGEKLPYVDLGKEKVTLLAPGYDHTCALLESGRVKCWGGNLGGTLGLGDKNHRGDQPNEMGEKLPNVDVGKGKVASLMAGSFRNCVLFESDQVKCWGANSLGQLGLGDKENRGDEPNEMGEGLPYIDLGIAIQSLFTGTSGVHTCAVLINNAIKCWGANFYGALGLGDTLPRGALPGDMGNNLEFVDLGF